jgi:hypothetical protein
MFHGVSQPLTISTDPAGAVCNLWRNGEPIGGVRGTPATITIDKSKDVLTIACDRKDYQRSYVQIEAQDDPLVGLDVILAPIALFFDEVIGAAHFYQPSVNVPMKPYTSRDRQIMRLEHGPG